MQSSAQGLPKGKKPLHNRCTESGHTAQQDHHQSCMPPLWYVVGVVVDSQSLDHCRYQETDRSDSCLPATDCDPALYPANKGSGSGRSVLRGPMILRASNGGAKTS